MYKVWDYVTGEIYATTKNSKGIIEQATSVAKIVFQKWKVPINK